MQDAVSIALIKFIDKLVLLRVVVRSLHLLDRILEGNLGFEASRRWVEPRLVGFEVRCRSVASQVELVGELHLIVTTVDVLIHDTRGVSSVLEVNHGGHVVRLAGLPPHKHLFELRFLGQGLASSVLGGLQLRIPVIAICGSQVFVCV